MQVSSVYKDNATLISLYSRLSDEEKLLAFATWKNRIFSGNAPLNDFTPQVVQHHVMTIAKRVKTLSQEIEDLKSKLEAQKSSSRRKSSNGKGKTPVEITE